MNTTKPSVLFVCVHNAGRSQMAAGYLRQLAGDRIEVRSAGSIPAEQINPVAVEAMREAGIDITAERPKVLTTEAVLLNPNRNPHLSKPEIERKLRDGLGVSEILWLRQGIEGDDTDGHIDDLARWDAALYDDRLLTSASRALAFGPHVEVTGEGYQARYGFGWRMTGDTQWHSGETIGFRNVIVRWPARHLSVVLLTNRNDSEPYKTALAIGALFQQP